MALLPKSHIAILSLRGLSLVFPLISLLLLANNSPTYEYNGSQYRFPAFESYSYMFSISIIGIGYTLLQTIAFVILQIMMKNDKYLVFAFYGDKAISYLLASAASAGIGASRDAHGVLDGTWQQRTESYTSKGFAAAVLLLPAFVCTAILSIISSYALPKKV
uniref:CASP-like protein n=1 Tax=Fagus sylvatica TaxID=28930 RepID=A0A2N9FU29_FAGSY